MSRSSLALATCILIGAVLGTLAGSERTRREPAELARVAQLRGEIDSLRTRFVDLQRELGTVATPAAATAARERLFQLRVDMAVLGDEIAELSRRTGVAR
jgi:hypothetical protein